MRLQGKTAVITGAATGIGRASALRFAQEGARLVLADTHDAAGDELAHSVAGLGGDACFVHTDVARRGDNERMIDMCVERYGGLDILFCNAGINLPKRLPESSDEEIARLLDVNVMGPLHAARHAIPIMLEQPAGGVILFTASKTGLVAQTDSPVYCASKGAVVILAKALALEECAEAALWLVSAEASFVTGVALPVDGGFTAM
jgi:NAD(P)-dependent dehydrogenase (short-subunit alcohol dehydrogenase family)